MGWNENLRRLAETLVNYSVEVNEGDETAIMGSDLAAPLVQELYRAVLVAGGHPSVICKPADLDYIFYQHASEEQLQHKPPLFKQVAETFDATIRIRSGHNTRSLTGIDGSRIARRRRATDEIMATFMQRAAEDELRWVLVQFPTHSRAQEAEMSLVEYREFFREACKLTQEDPVALWEGIEEEQERIIEFLNGVSDIRIVAPDTDLELSTAGRTWINCCGKRNYPDGEVFTGPLENSATGHIRFSFPGIYSGREIRDIRLEFEDGEVTDASAEKGEHLLRELLDTDDGAKRLGELGIGTNHGIQKFTRNMLFDEKMGGTVHLALGRGYPASGSENESGIHWDILCDMREGGQIYADGEVIYEDGKFSI
ncbi:MAG: aminopeptidase [Planctomycetota bacterium]